ncbi:MAG TPA: YciI family protein, partial [Caulobacteraceae bacterium]
ENGDRVMPLFVISWLDKPDHLHVRMANREAHLAYAAETGVVRLGGPFLDDEGEMIGSMIVMEADNLEMAHAWHALDPYRTAGLFDTSQVLPWRATVGAIA